MKTIGFNTGIRYNWHVLDVLRVFKQLKVDKIEIWGASSHADLTSSRLIRRLADLQRERSLDFVAIHPPARGSWDIANEDEEKRLGAVKLLKVVLDNVLQIGVDKIVLHPGGRRSTSETEVRDQLIRSADSIERLLEHIKDREQNLCIENTLPHHIGGSLDDLVWLEKNVNSNFYITIDSSHAYLGDNSVFEYIDHFGKKIRHTHLGDNFGDEDDHLTPGEGNIDFSRILRELSEKCNLDYWMLEILRAPGISRLEGLIEYSRDEFNKLLQSTFERPTGRKSSS